MTLLLSAMVVLYSVKTLTEITLIGTQIPRSGCSQLTISASCLVGVAMFVRTYVPFSWCKQMTRQPLSCRECIRNIEKVREPEATFTTRLQLPLCLLAALPCPALLCPAHYPLATLGSLLQRHGVVLTVLQVCSTVPCQLSLSWTTSSCAPNSHSSCSSPAQITQPQQSRM